MIKLSKAFSIFILVSCYLLLVTPVSAHILKTDGSIGAVLHIDPDDDPIINQPAYFFFEFRDLKNKFNLDSCSCTLNIEKDGQQVFSQSLNAGGNKTTSANLSYTFNQKGVYQVKVSGSSLDNSFSSFTLNYDLRVSRESGNKTPNSLMLTLFAPAAIIVVFLIITFWKGRSGNEKIISK